MDKNSRSVQDFEVILKKQSTTGSVSIYGHKKDSDVVNLPQNAQPKIINAQYIISSVAKQLRAIQNADCSKNERKRTLDMQKYKKSSFLPVNMLNKDLQPVLQNKQFETQNFSDTQLINVVQNAENIITHDGVTQEFETSFCQPDEDNDDIKHGIQPQNNQNFPVLDISLKEPDPNQILHAHNINKGLSQTAKVESSEYPIDRNIWVAINCNKTMADTQFENCTQILNECIKTEEIDQLDGVVQLNEDPFISQTSSANPPSPVFSVKSKKVMSKPSSPIVCNLETFEKFEQIAQPIIEESSDLEVAKKVINSQILGKELFILTNMEPVAKKIKRVSPIIELSEDVLKVDHNSPTKSKVEERMKAIKENDSKENSPSKFVLKDEILFSSDEENEDVHKTYQDLPYTCALETSFYDQEEDLDKTMYVGFQTASDKSILVSTNSFYKAKSFLLKSDIDCKPSLTDLVEICDSNVNKESKTPISISMNGNSAKDIYFNFKRELPNSPEMEEFMDAEHLNKDLTPEKYNEEKSAITSDDKKDPSTEDVEEYLHLDFYTPKEILCDNNTIKSVNVKQNFKADCSKTQENKCPLEQKDLADFKPVSHNPIKLSDMALGKWEIVLNDVDFSDKNDKEPDTTVRLSDKEVVIKTENDQIKAQQIDEEFNQEFEDEMLHIELKENTKKIGEINDLVMFKTASNKSIKISSTALAKSKKIFEEIDAVDEVHTRDLTTQMSDNVVNSDESEKSEVLSQILEISTKKGNKKSNILVEPTKSSILTCTGSDFKTASNKDIKISENTLSKIKDVFHDIDILEDIAKPTNLNKKENYRRNTQKPDDNFVIDTELQDDFLRDNFEQTLLSKTTLVGEEPVEAESINTFDSITSKAKHDLLDTANQTSDQNVDHKDSFIHSKDSENSISNKKYPFITENKDTFVGFNTASNKKVSISAEAMAKSKRMLMDFDKESKNVEDNQDDLEPPFHGFEETDKNISLFEEVLAKSQKIFQKLGFKQDAAVKTKEQGIDIKSLRFAGFQTASNKPVKISEAALEHSKKIFQDINDYANKDEQLVSNPDETCCERNIPGFQTASNKPIEISKEALASSKKILDEVDNVESHVNNSVPAARSNFLGFQTASHKQIMISESALIKSKKLLQDIDDHSNDVTKITRSSKFDNFHTASNEKQKISEETNTKSMKMFQDIDNDDQSSNIANIAGSSKFCGFQTASNKKVIISKKSLAKSKKIFEDIDNYDQPSNITITSGGSNFIGFQTASYKKVAISAESLAKTKKIFDNIYNYDQPSNTTNTTNTAGSNFIGFQTASNKTVKISEESLKKSKQMFQEMDLNNHDLKTTKTFDSKFSGFQTASNKKVNISEEALAKSKKLFQDIDDSHDDNKDIVAQPKNEKFCGFQTASNKKIKVSEEALAKTKKLFQDIDNNDDNVTTTKEATEVKTVGFQTASDKKVTVSDAALANSKKLLENTEDTKLQNFNFQGFQTASSKKVEVSKEALALSKQLFGDLDLDNNFDDKINEQSNLPQTMSKSTKEFGFKTGTNKDIKVSEEALVKSKKILTNSNNTSKVICDKKEKINNKNNDVDNIINTQIANNFEVDLNTEDFCKTPKESKRSGSPILSCPKAKKRKTFQIPYSQKVVNKTDENVQSDTKIASRKVENIYNFNKDYKKSKCYMLKDLQNLEEKSLDRHEKIDKYILQFNFDNLMNFQFSGKRNDLTSSVLSLDELKNIFLESVSKKLVPNGWLDIHIQLIIWKLISYEIMFPKTMSNTCTAKNLLEQLKYRYNKELYNAERPALRKILEKDDTSMRTLVLCVVAVCEESSASPELILTDGWYTIRAVIDKMLAKYVQSGRIAVGTKLVTHGAELVGGEQAVSPWENTSSIRLKLSGNSTRRARWDTSLGYHGNGAILSSLSAICPTGGRVSRVRVFVSRVYPPLYVDKLEGGSTVTRSERLEHIYQMKYESERQTLMEKLYEDVEKEIYKQESQDSEDGSESGSKRKPLDSGSQIAKMMKRSRDPAEFRSHLTSTQNALLEAHSCQDRERLIQAIQTKMADKMAAHGLDVNRNVVPLLKVRVAGVEETRGGVEVTKALLSIWKPNDAVVEMLKEGIWVEILNVIPTGVRYSELQLSAGRQSVFSLSRYQENEKIKAYTKLLIRTCYPIKDLLKNPAMTTDYNEIDTSGIIFQIDPSVKDFDLNRHQFQNVYLTDLDKNIICINFWGGLKKFGFENVLESGQVISCKNLQKRAGNTRKNIPQYRVTEFSHFTKMPKNENARKLIEELSGKLSKIDRTTFFDDCIRLKNNYAVKQQSNENISPYRFPNMDINTSKNKMFLDSPLAQNNKKIEDNLNLTGLDFESTFKQKDTQELSPKTLLRKQQVKQKIARLKMYGEPPALSPIQIINKSRNAAGAFKSPLISKSDASINVTSEKKSLPNQKELHEDIQCSPVICLNRTYVKKNVNPVKLNFSNDAILEDNNVSEVVDDFAEEFDCSPPLSLD